MLVLPTSREAPGGPQEVFWGERPWVERWIAQTLATATRGTRPEPPQLAVLLAKRGPGEAEKLRSDPWDRIGFWSKAARRQRAGGAAGREDGLPSEGCPGSQHVPVGENVP